MKVPFVDLQRSTRRFADAAHQDFRKILDNSEFVLGPTVARLEAAMAKALDAPHFLSCANGTDALIIGLQALGIGPGKKVAIPNLTFWATYEAVVQIGATPVLIDTDPDHCQMSLAELKKAHDKFRLDGVIFVHLFGWTSPELRELRAYCESSSIQLLEDGAQAFGVKYNGKSVFADAKLGTISFYPGKVIGGAMDGGGFTSTDPKLIELAKKLCNHGRSSHYTYSHVGWNSRMGGLQASWLLRVLEKADELVESRRQALSWYGDLLGDRLRPAPAGVTGNGYLAVLSPKAPGAEVAKKLTDAGIGNARTYPETMDMQPPTKDALRIGELRNSRAFCENVVNLPLFAYITKEECALAAKEYLKITGA